MGIGLCIKSGQIEYAQMISRCCSVLDIWWIIRNGKELIIDEVRLKVETRFEKQRKRKKARMMVVGVLRGTLVIFRMKKQNAREMRKGEYKDEDG